MRNLLLLLCIILLSISCSSTKAFVSPEVLSPEIPVEEKLIAADAVPVSVDFPEIFFDGAVYLERITELFNQAEDYILITTFLGSESPALEGMYRALMDAAERGVRVYFVMDGLSSFDMTESRLYMTPLYFLRSSGVNLIEYNPVTATHLFNPATIVIRDHRKMVVIDGEIAAIGGMNMNYISMGAGEGETQRDSMYLFHSASLAAALRNEFVDIWNESSVEKIRRDEFYVAETAEGEYQAWLVPTEGVAAMYASLLGSAEKCVLIFPYLPALDAHMKECIKTVTDRGVPVDMVMPVDLRGYAASGVYHGLPELIRSTGASIYLSVYDGDGNVLSLLHEKLMIVDSRYVVIGSANFNFRSMTLSKELALVIDSPELASFMEDHAERIAEYAEYISVEEADRLKKEDGNILAYLFTFFGG